MLLFLVATPFVLFAQERSDTVLHKDHHTPKEIIRYDSQNKRSIRRLYWDTGELMYEEIYLPVGEYNFDATEFYKSGKKEFVRHYENDLAEGKSNGWYETGEIMSSENCIHDTCSKITYFQSGRIKAKKNMIHGRMISEEIFCENGQLTNREFADSASYDYTTYYCNGKVKYKGTLRYGAAFGKWEQYYENGNMEMSGQLSNIDSLRDQIHIGEWRSYNENGELTWINIYDEKGVELERKKMK